jgi:hypothetical protein
VNLEIPIHGTSKFSTKRLRFAIRVANTILDYYVTIRCGDGELIAIPRSSSFPGIDPVDYEGIALFTVICSGATENSIIRNSLGHSRTLVTFFGAGYSGYISLEMVQGIASTIVIDVIPLAPDASVFHGHGISAIAVISPVLVQDPSSAGYPAPVSTCRFTGYGHGEVTVIVGNVAIYPIVDAQVQGVTRT